MANVIAWGGDPDRTTGNFGYSNAYVYTSGLSFPTGNPSLTGGADVYVETVGIDYASGGTGLSARVLRGSTRTTGNAWIGGSGGTCTLELFHSGGTTYFGRNTASNDGTGTTTLSADGYVWDGVLCGWMEYSTNPGTPGSISVSRSGLSVTVSWGSASDGGNALVGYSVQYSTNGGSTWTGTVNTATSTFSHTFSGLTAGASYLFRVYARNSRGSGAARTSGTVTMPTVPGTPTGLSATRTSRNVALSWTAPSNGGETITGYTLSYSTNGGSTWSTAVSTTSTSYTFSNLQAGLTYVFRVAAVNVVGTGSYATSASVFVPAGGRRWTGSTWQPTGTARRWNGSQWVDLTVAKRWTGSTWADLT